MESRKLKKCNNRTEMFNRGVQQQFRSSRRKDQQNKRQVLGSNSAQAEKKKRILQSKESLRDLQYTVHIM